jgi:DNA-directed RNA polymerase specialized sigma24 family protein
MKSPSSQRTIPVTSPCLVTVVTSPARPANTNGKARPDVATRNREIADLYNTHAQKLVATAARHLRSKAEADDVVQEAFTILLESPARTANRGALWAIVRDLSRERMSNHANTVPFVDDDLQDADELHPCRRWVGRLLE